MNLKMWLKQLFSQSNSRPARQARKRQAHLRLEQLEDRLVPSTILVNTSENWSQITTGTGPAGAPSAADSIIVGSGATLTVDVSSATVGSIVLGSNGSGQLAFAAANQETLTLTNLTVGSGSNKALLDMSAPLNPTLNISGALTFTPNLASFNRGTASIIDFDGTTQTIPSQSYDTVQITSSGSRGVSLSGQIAVYQELDLYLGSLALNGQTLTMENGTTIDRSKGNIGSAPIFAGSVNVIYNGSTALFTGPELPKSTTALDNLTINDAAGVTLQQNATVNDTLNLTSGLLTNSANTLTMASGTLLTRSAGSILNAPVFAGTVNVLYLATLSTGPELPTSATALNNLTIGVFDDPIVTLTHNVTINGTLTIGNDNSTFIDGGYTITANGDWDNYEGSTGFSATGLVIFSGPTAQTLEGVTDFNNVTMNGAGLTIDDDISVAGTLSFTSGDITAYASVVEILQGGIVSGASSTNGYINGAMEQYVPTGSNQTLVYEVGTATAYDPFIINFSGTTTGGYLFDAVASGNVDLINTSGLDPNHSVNDDWYLGLPEAGGVTFTGSYSITFNFTAGDLGTGTNTSELVVGKLDDGTWTFPTVGTLTPTSTQALGMTSIGDYGSPTQFQVAEIAPSTLTITPVTTSYYPSTVALFNSDQDGLPFLNQVYRDPATGNLFVTTTSGGVYGAGTLLEIPAGTSNFVTLATFDGVNGANPRAGLVEDANGNLYGITQNGGQYDDGSVFEFLANSHTLITLASFDGPNGQYPLANILLHGGNIYGTTSQGGLGGDNGTIFELAAGSSTITTLYSFTGGADGADPQSDIYMDGSGNIYASTYAGGANSYDDGTVFELLSGGSSWIALSFDYYVNGSEPSGSIYVNGAGDVFGTVNEAVGGSEVYEANFGSSSITILASFGSVISPNGVIEANGNLYGTTKEGGSSGDGSVFEVVGGASGGGSLSVITLASFNGATTGAGPSYSPAMDANGNFYGANFLGGTYDDGTVWELASGGGSLSAISLNVNTTTGTNPESSLIVDDAGNLYGTASAGGEYGDGAVVEVPAGTNNIITLASFDRTVSGATPQGGLVMDDSGDLFGTTSAGGANGDGTIFELPSGSSSVIVLASFSDATGSFPAGSLIMDANGDLLGTALDGGAHGDGTIFELVTAEKGYSSTITVLASFNNPTTGANPEAALLMDANGNLYGTASTGGAYNDGTIFELAYTGSTLVNPTGYSSTITLLATFNGVNGSLPESTLIFGGNGALIGTAVDGGTSGDGVIFELPEGSSTLVVLASFDGADGLNPDAGVVLDSQGYLLGTTYSDSLTGDGVAYEFFFGGLEDIQSDGMSKATIKVLDQFNGPNGANPLDGLVADNNGDFYGTTFNGGSSGDGVVFELQPEDIVTYGTPLTISGHLGGEGNIGSGGTVTVDVGSYSFLATLDSSDDFSAGFSGYSPTGISASATPYNVNFYYSGSSSGSISGSFVESPVSTLLLVNQATPTVTVADEGGTFNNAAFSASASVNGVLAGVDTTPSGSLEGVSLTTSYYSGSASGGTALGAAPTSAGTYTVVASFPGSTDYVSGTAQATFTIAQAVPTVTVTDAGGSYNGDPYPASASVSGVSGSASATLEGNGLTLTYYSGSSATGTSSGTAPTAAGIYTVVASFPGSADYTSASAQATFTIVGPPTTKLVIFQETQIAAGSPFIVNVTAESLAGVLDWAFTGSVTLSLVNNPGSASFTGTLTETAVNGQATFSDLELSTVGVGYQIEAQANVNNALNTTNSIPFAVSPAPLIGGGVFHTAQPTAPVAPFALSQSPAPSVVHDGPGYTYSIAAGGFTPLFSIEEQFGLEPVVQPTSLAQLTTANFEINAHNANELNLVSVTGGNLGNAGAYFIVPNGNLYALNGVSIASSEATGFITALGASVYNDPELLYDPSSVPYMPLASSLETELDLQQRSSSSNYFYDARGLDERYLQSGNGNNPTEQGFYVLLPNGNLYAWTNDMADTLATTPLGTLPAPYYQSPILLTSPTPQGNLATVTGTVTSGVLTLTDTGFQGTVIAYATTPAGTQEYVQTFNDSAPVVTQPPATLTGSSDTAKVITLNSTDVAGDSVTYAATVGGYNSLFDLEQQLQLQPANPSGTGSAMYYTNTRGAGEKYLISTNGSNPAGSEYYVLVPEPGSANPTSANLYAWTSANNLMSAEAGTAIGVSVAAYNTPTLITNAQAPYNPTALAAQSMYDLKAPQTSNYFLNARGYGEKYLISGNGSNPAGGGYYVLVPNGNLYAWTDNSILTTLDTVPVASGLPVYYYQTPTLLFTAVPAPVPPTGVTVNVTGDTLTVTPNGYVGTVTVFITVSDGILTSVETTEITFNPAG